LRLHSQISSSGVAKSSSGKSLIREAAILFAEVSNSAMISSNLSSEAKSMDAGQGEGFRIGLILSGVERVEIGRDWTCWVIGMVMGLKRCFAMLSLGMIFEVREAS
jgi:hypothetical protein